MAGGRCEDPSSQGRGVEYYKVAALIIALFLGGCDADFQHVTMANILNCDQDPPPDGGAYIDSRCQVVHAEPSAPFYIDQNGIIREIGAGDSAPTGAVMCLSDRLESLEPSTPCYQAALSAQERAIHAEENTKKLNEVNEWQRNAEGGSDLPSWVQYVNALGAITGGLGACAFGAGTVYFARKAYLLSRHLANRDQYFKVYESYCRLLVAVLVRPQNIDAELQEAMFAKVTGFHLFDGNLQEMLYELDRRVIALNEAYKRLPPIPWAEHPRRESLVQEFQDLEKEKFDLHDKYKELRRKFERYFLIKP